MRAIVSSRSTSTYLKGIAVTSRATLLRPSADAQEFAALGIPAGKGERAVASFDEDSVSMAVEATRDALRAAGSPPINTLLFATTTPPYAEKLNAAMIGAAARLPLEMRAADLTGSTRAG